MKIGNIRFKAYPLVLAPMEDVTDPPFRYFCKQFGADLMFSEFVSSEALIRKVGKTLRKLEIHPYEHPYAIQLYGRNTSAMVESARISEEYHPDFIDINFGCPVKKVALKGAGAGFLRDVPHMLKMAREVVAASQLPVTVKTRLGWDHDSRFIVDIAERLQDTGISALTIHGRTRAQLYKGEADWSLIGAVKNNPRIKIPIIGNGDIDGPEKAKEMFDRYGVDAVMIGRAAIGRPWIFKEIRHFLDTGNLLPPPRVTDQVSLIRAHLSRVSAQRDDHRAILSMRRFFAVSFKGIHDFRETRIKLLQAIEIEKVHQILDEISDKWGHLPAHSSVVKEK